MSKLFLILILIGVFPQLSGASVELHTHAFMNQAAPYLFQGGFSEPIRAKKWNDRLQFQVNAETILESGISVLVVSLYAHPLGRWDMRQSIRDQLESAHSFVQANPVFGIARSPEDARLLLAHGRRVMILSLEGASGILEDDSDISEFIDRGGIRLVTMVHFLDDGFGGPALLYGLLKVLNPWAAFRALFDPRDSEVRTLLNPKGLGTRGTWLTQTLLDHGVWLDLSHASDALLRDLSPLLESRHHPWLFTHTVLRRYHDAERGIPEWALEKTRSSGGMIGLMPSEVMLARTQVSPEFCPSVCKPSECENGIHRLATQWKDAMNILPDAFITTGVDYNGTIDRIAPSCGLKTPMDQQGLVHIGQHQRIWEGLKILGLKIKDSQADRIRHFLDAWTRVSQNARK